MLRGMSYLKDEAFPCFCRESSHFLSHFFSFPMQCFCFEEQWLNPQEEVDMPVFFYIDPEFAEDPKMAKVDSITLSYTFFEAKEGQHLPLPGYQ